MKTETLDMPSDLITASYCTHVKITLTQPVDCHNHQRHAPSYLHSCSRKSSMLYATNIRYTNFNRLRASSIMFNIHYNMINHVSIITCVERAHNIKYSNSSNYNLYIICCLLT